MKKWFFGRMATMFRALARWVGGASSPLIRIADMLKATLEREQAALEKELADAEAGVIKRTPKEIAEIKRHIAHSQKLVAKARGE